MVGKPNHQRLIYVDFLTIIKYFINPNGVRSNWEILARTYYGKA